MESFIKILKDINEREITKEVLKNLKFKLYQNFPNPFNVFTDIQFSIPGPSFVKLSIFDMFDREVKILINETKLEGIYNVKLDSSNLTSGSYFCKLSCKTEKENFSEIRKIDVLAG